MFGVAVLGNPDTTSRKVMYEVLFSEFGVMKIPIVHR